MENFIDEYLRKKAEQIKTALSCYGVDNLSDEDIMSLALDCLEREVVALFNLKIGEGANGDKLEN